MPAWIDGKLMFFADSPPRRLLELFAVKWSTMVLHALYHWPDQRARTGELQRSLQGISKKCWCRRCVSWSSAGWCRARYLKWCRLRWSTR